MRIEIQNNRIGPENAYLRFCLCVNDIRVCAMTSTPRLTSATVVVVLLTVVWNGCLLTVSYAVRSVRFGHPNPGEKRELFGTYSSFFLPNLKNVQPTSSKRRNEKPMAGSVVFFSFRSVTPSGRKQFPVDFLFLFSLLHRNESSSLVSIPIRNTLRSSIPCYKSFFSLSFSRKMDPWEGWHTQQQYTQKQITQKQPSSCNIVRTLEIVQRCLPEQRKILNSH